MPNQKPPFTLILVLPSPGSLIQVPLTICLCMAPNLQITSDVRNFVYSNHFISHFSERKTLFPWILILDMTLHKYHEQQIWLYCIVWGKPPQQLSYANQYSQTLMYLPHIRIDRLPGPVMCLEFPWVSWVLTSRMKGSSSGPLLQWEKSPRGGEMCDE